MDRRRSYVYLPRQICVRVIVASVYPALPGEYGSSDFKVAIKLLRNRSCEFRNSVSGWNGGWGVVTLCDWSGPIKFPFAGCWLTFFVCFNCFFTVRGLRTQHECFCFDPRSDLNYPHTRTLLLLAVTRLFYSLQHTQSFRLTQQTRCGSQLFDTTQLNSKPL